MVMISEETLDDYQKRSKILSDSFMKNLSKAKDLVIEDSPVDFETHRFICFCYSSRYESIILWFQFSLYFVRGECDNILMTELIEEFHSLEKELASQNDTLEKLTEKSATSLKR